MAADELRIAVLLPDVLNTYSDTGNAEVLARRATWAGLAVTVEHVTADRVPPALCDLYLLGGGEDEAQVFAVQWLARHRDLVTALGGGAHVLAVCAGLQILGTHFTDAHGTRHDGLGVLDATTAPLPVRAVGEVVARCTIPGVGLLTGFANHGGGTVLGAGVAPLGRIVAGAGNGPADPEFGQVDGAVSGRILATYLHGPVLARNPALADHLLASVTGAAYAPPPLARVPEQYALRTGYLSPVVQRDQAAGPSPQAGGRGGRRALLAVLVLAALVLFVLVAVGVRV